MCERQISARTNDQVNMRVEPCNMFQCLQVQIPESCNFEDRYKFVSVRQFLGKRNLRFPKQKGKGGPITKRGPGLAEDPVCVQQTKKTIPAACDKPPTIFVCTCFDIDVNVARQLGQIVAPLNVDELSSNNMFLRYLS